MPYPTMMYYTRYTFYSLALLDPSLNQKNGTNYKIFSASVSYSKRETGTTKATLRRVECQNKRNKQEKHG